MNKRSIFLSIFIIAGLGIAIYALIDVTSRVVLPPCNPLCFPGSYDTSNPDCPCNK